MEPLTELIILIVLAVLVIWNVRTLVKYIDMRNIQDRREHVLGYLVDGEINRLTYQSLSLPTVDERIDVYYQKDELTEDLLDYIENNFIRLLSEKLEKIEESKRPKHHSPYKQGQMTLQEIDKIVEPHLNALRNQSTYKIP